METKIEKLKEVKDKINKAIANQETYAFINNINLSDISSNTNSAALNLINNKKYL